MGAFVIFMIVLGGGTAPTVAAAASFPALHGPSNEFRALSGPDSAFHDLAGADNTFREMNGG